MTSMYNKKIQKFFEANGKENHRSLVVMVGEGGKTQIPNVHKTLSKCSYGPVSTIVWCHKNEVTKRTGQEAISRKKQKNKIQADETEDDDLSIFLRANEVEFIEYKESEKILGQTIDMLVLQDFEALSPNLIATSMETVRGGGVIVLLLDSVNSIEALISRRTDIHADIAESKHISPRYNRRLFRSLMESEFVLFLDDKGTLLDLGNGGIRDVDAVCSSEKINVADAAGGLEDTIDVLKSLSRTRDQRILIDEIFNVLESRTERAVYSVTAPRGRGKSAALGISIAQAMNIGFLSIYVASPALENVEEVFQFVVVGLEKLGYKRYVDFKIIYQFKGNKRLIHRIELVKDRKQAVEYFDPFNSLKYYPDLLVIDEAAAIPLTFLMNLMFPNLIIMATTVNGYEGTGRAFSVKLSEYLRKGSMEPGSFIYKELTLKESIRYGRNDPVENWLYKTLLLETHVPKIVGCPNPAGCGLFYVDRDVLFSGKPASEKFLNDAFSLFISSHYKNSPNDLQILADSPRHEIFTLLTPVEDNGRDMPSIVCSIQVSFEGRCKKTEFSKEGNLIPWIVSEEHMDTTLLDRYGVRVVRIAVHPEYISMGYGKRALDLLAKFLSGQSGSMECGVEIRNKDEDNVLLYTVDDIFTPQVSWIAASFGITEPLYNFWSRSGFLPVGIKQTITQTTGEHSAIFLKALKDNECDMMRYNQTFRSRFVGQLSSSFKHFSPSLCLSLIYGQESVENKTPTTYFAQRDIHRIRMASRGKIDMNLVIDLIPDISRMYFHGKFAHDLSVLRKSVLLMVGCQHRSIKETADVLTLKPFQILNILAKVLELIVDELESKYTINET